MTPGPGTPTRPEAAGPERTAATLPSSFRAGGALPQGRGFDALATPAMGAMGKGQSRSAPTAHPTHGRPMTLALDGKNLPAASPRPEVPAQRSFSSLTLCFKKKSKRCPTFLMGSAGHLLE